MIRPISFVFALVMLAASSAFAQVDPEVAGRARGGYAWGQGENAGAGPVARGPDDPLRIMAFAGAGLSVRLVNNTDFGQDRMAPYYLNVAGAVFLPGREIRHGFGLGISTNLTEDPPGTDTVQAFAQWVFTPSYYLLVPCRYFGTDTVHDWLTIMGHAGIPLAVSPNFVWGVEVGGGLVFKFLAGLGLYLNVQLDLYGGAATSPGDLGTVHPNVSSDVGLVFDYEVLP